MGLSYPLLFILITACVVSITIFLLFSLFSTTLVSAKCSVDVIFRNLYVKIDSCSAGCCSCYNVSFIVVNTGNVGISSLDISVVNVSNGKVILFVRVKFERVIRSGCQVACNVGVFGRSISVRCSVPVSLIKYEVHRVCVNSSYVLVVQAHSLSGIIAVSRTFLSVFR